MKHFDHGAVTCSWLSNDTLECLTYIRSIGDFASCDPAEYIRVFPRLLPRDGGVPVALRAHVTRCLAVLAWRSMARGDDAAMVVLSAAPRTTVAEMTLLGAREHGRWFPGAATDASRASASRASASRASTTPPSVGMVDELEAFALVNAVRREIDAAALRAFDPEVAAVFTFTTGIHAAYLWPEALLSHEFYTAVGWLGHLWRGRRADMPGDLAEYFDDVIDLGADGAPRVRDRHLARFLPGHAPLGEVRRAVLARLSGCRAVAIWPSAAPRAASDGTAPPPWAGRPW